MKPKMKALIYLAFASAIFAGCNKDALVTPPPESAQKNVKTNGVRTESTQLLAEDFEQGSKTSYAAGDVALTSGSWNLSDALIGTLANDRKEGAKSVRVRNSGIASMNFDLNATGSVTVTVKHAVYGTDGNGSWELWASANQGGTYVKVGNTITAASTTLQTASFSYTASGKVRFDIRKTDGGSNRINFDTFVVTAGSVDTTGTGGGGVPGDNDNLLLGNPSNASSSIVLINNYLMDKTYFKLSYSRDKGEPNWVSWHIGASDLGSNSRSNNFRADNTLPAGWYQVSQTSYTGSGFDRGHNCPSGDRTADATANSTTFLMTNMIPQAPNNNRNLWANLENYIRTLVTAGNEVYVVMGSYGSGGTGSNGSAGTIDNGNVNVPSNIWKVVVVIPNGNNDLSRITTTTRVIAVNTPNDNSVSADWKSYLTSVNNIESATNYTLLSNVPANIASVLKSKVDSGN
ncbi:endonuclease G [Chitinophaga niastensis]|uniref:Endonuclease G n=1 Tax=Chitinophaga niastensis TaxID=536980 RepID=A0A2P8HHC1_CHINA|nr:DNA/RNA non-specific endonuclease [Chitinophaga niastensis]PSL45601.1 endonuclease G [Chitinophaga niastensis]